MILSRKLEEPSFRWCGCQNLHASASVYLVGAVLSDHPWRIVERNDRLYRGDLCVRRAKVRYVLFDEIRDGSAQEQ